MTNKQIVAIGAVIMAASFAVFLIDGKLLTAAFVKVSPDSIEIGDISEDSAAKLFVWAVVFTSGIAVLAMGAKSKDVIAPRGRKR